jgi:hypothetical protein
MKTYKQSILSHYSYIGLVFTLSSLSITVFNPRHFEVNILSLILIFSIIALYIFVVIRSRYIFASNELLICSGFDKKKIDINRIEAISKTKVLFTNNYKLQLHPRRYNQIDLYPKQADIDNFINEIININPNIIVKELMIN